MVEVSLPIVAFVAKARRTHWQKASQYDARGHLKSGHSSSDATVHRPAIRDPGMYSPFSWAVSEMVMIRA